MLNLCARLPSVCQSIVTIHGSVVIAKKIVIWIQHQINTDIFAMHVQAIVLLVLGMLTVPHVNKDITDLYAKASVLAVYTIFVIRALVLVCMAAAMVTIRKQTTHVSYVHRDVCNVPAQIHVPSVRVLITGGQHVKIRVRTVPVAANLVDVLIATWATIKHTTEAKEVMNVFSALGT